MHGPDRITAGMLDQACNAADQPRHTQPEDDADQNADVEVEIDIDIVFHRCGRVREPVRMGGLARSVSTPILLVGSVAGLPSRSSRSERGLVGEAGLEPRSHEAADSQSALITGPTRTTQGIGPVSIATWVSFCRQWPLVKVLRLTGQAADTNHPEFVNP